MVNALSVAGHQEFPILSSDCPEFSLGHIKLNVNEGCEGLHRRKQSLRSCNT